MTTQSLTLRQIAAWQIADIKAERKIVARLPALQRGPVWKAEQIEMLWDSIFRGYPIGSLLISPKITKQESKISYISGTKFDSGFTHHLLDGQQRCNSIALGFYLPKHDDAHDHVQSMLWLDLAHELSPESKRKYLFRVCTMAHPWGYDKSDSSSTLSHQDRLKFREKYDEIIQDKEKDGFLKLAYCVPYKSTMPIPLKLLFKYYDNGNINWDKMQKEDNDWIELICKWKDIKKDDLAEKIKSNELIKKIKEVQKINIPIIETDKKAIEDIEIIFSRLNNQGTPISQEELKYSLIKSHFPEIEEILKKTEESLSFLPMGEARLVSLMIRLWRIKNKKEYKTVSIEHIRDILKKGEGCNLKEFFENNTANYLKWVEENLIFSEDNIYGIPPYIRSSIAWTNEEIYLWWLILADRYSTKNEPLQEDIKKRILAISLALHWFPENRRKHKIYNNFLEKIATEKDDKLYFMKWHWIEDLQINDILPEILTLEDFKNDLMKRVEKKELQENDNQEIASLWDFILNFDHDTNNKKINEMINIKLFHFYNKIWDNKELLVYAQRKYLSKMNYDPSNKWLWQDHNRPWDYDHMVPKNHLNGRTYDHGKYTNTCKVFLDSIGNKMAISFSENRSKGSDNIKIDNEVIKEAFTLDGNYNITEGHINIFENFVGYKKNDPASEYHANNLESSHLFLKSVAERLYTLYSIWYDTLDVGKLLAPKKVETNN